MLSAVGALVAAASVLLIPGRTRPAMSATTLGRMTDMGAPLDQYAEVETGEAFTLQNPRLLKIELSATTVMARNGSMVAYQGDVRFEHKGGGLGRHARPRRASSPR